jgi:hypothetical protein
MRQVNLFINMGLILKGMHYGFGHFPWPFFGDGTIKRSVVFSESCAYDLGNSDQQDWNKLFGLSFGGFHHQNSVRYVWRYNTTLKLIEIGAYWYEDGVRNSKRFFHAEIGKKYDMEITVTRSRYLFSVRNEKLFMGVPKKPTKPWGYQLGLYFGGNQVAPHNIKVKIS